MAHNLPHDQPPARHPIPFHTTRTSGPMVGHAEEFPLTHADTGNRSQYLLRNRAVGMLSSLRYLATVRRAMWPMPASASLSRI